MYSIYRFLCYTPPPPPIMVIKCQETALKLMLVCDEVVICYIQLITFFSLFFHQCNMCTMCILFLFFIFSSMFYVYYVYIFVLFCILPLCGYSALVLQNKKNVEEIMSFLLLFLTHFSKCQGERSQTLGIHLSVNNLGFNFISRNNWLI